MATLYHGHRNKSIEMLQQELFYMESYILVYGEYVNAHVPVDCECINCGYQWKRSPNSLLAGDGCIVCAGNLRLTLHQIEQDLLKIGKPMRLTGEYLNTSSVVRCECLRCGLVRDVVAANIRKGACPGCSRRLPWTIEKIREKLASDNRAIHLLSEEYQNALSNLKFGCDICHFQWEACVSNIFSHRETGCSNCAKTGFKFLRPANLYYIRISFGDVVLYKVGISCKTTLRRYSASEKVKLEVLYEYKFSTGREAYQAEQNILNIFQDFLYKGAKVLLSGNTEIFTKDVLQMGHLKPKAVKNAQ